MPIKILLIPADIERPVAQQQIKPTLDGMKAAIGGGWLELFGPTDADALPWAGYVDEEGKIKGQPVNIRATEFARRIGWATGDILCGDAIFVGPGDEEGNDTDVPDGIVAAAILLGFL